MKYDLFVSRRDNRKMLEQIREYESEREKLYEAAQAKKSQAEAMSSILGAGDRELDFGNRGRSILLTFTRALVKYDSYLVNLMRLSGETLDISTADSFFLKLLRAYDRDAAINTCAIHDLAEAYRSHAGEGKYDMETVPKAFREGPVPELYIDSSIDKLAEMLVRKVGLFIETLGYDPENITILAPTKHEISAVTELLEVYEEYRRRAEQQ